MSDQEESQTTLDQKGQRITSIADSDDDQGEDVQVPSKENPVVYSEDDEDDSDNMEVTEEDRRFIVDDEEEEEEEKKKKKRRKRSEEEEEDLDEDDLDLIQDNLGFKSQKRFKKLRKKGQEQVRKVASLDKIFSDDEQEKQPIEEEEEEMDDFIVEGSGSSEEIELNKEQRKMRKALRPSDKRLQEYGITEEAQDDIFTIFGDGTDYLWALDKTLLGIQDEEEEKTVNLADIYEPSEIKARMLTSKDEEIRITDLPERYQSREQVEMDDDFVQKEASFIARILLDERRTAKKPVSNDNAFARAVQYVVKFLRLDNFEVPFINAQRKDYFARFFDLEDLWRIHDLDSLFHSLIKKLLKLKQTYDEILPGDEEIPPLQPDAYLEKQLGMLSYLTFEKISDLHNYMYYNYGDYINALEKKKGLKKEEYKRARRRNAVEDAKKAGLSDFAKLYGINVDDYLAPLLADVAKKPPSDLCEEAPEEAALKYVNSTFYSVDQVLEATRRLIASDISMHPEMKLFLRNVFMCNSLVSVRPTPRGRTEIDTMHEFYPFKYLKDKDVIDFKDGQYLQIQRAEQMGLVTVEVKVDNEEKLVGDLNRYITSDFRNETVMKWNEERKKVVALCIEEYLFPAAQKYVKERLAANAADFIAQKCQSELLYRINQAPWKEQFKVVAISWGDGSKLSPTVAVSVDENGELVDHVEIHGLQEIKPELKQDQLKELEDFLQASKPNIVVVGGFNPLIKTRLYEDVCRAIESYNIMNMDRLEAVFINDDVCRIMMNSQLMQKEFPDQKQLLCYCVSLCRRIQDPQSEYARLFNEYDDYKLLKLDPLCHLLTEKKYLESLSRVMMNVVADVGVDINMAMRFKHKQYTLQFVSGLGKRKAASIYLKIQQHGSRLESRADLVVKKMIGPFVFLNASSFIRIRKRWFKRKREEVDLDVLDDTRVHPEDYDLARKMAADAEELVDAAVDDENASLHVKELMESADAEEKLNQLLLDDYAAELEKSLRVPKLICLKEIKQELLHPFEERRRQFEPLSVDELFYSLSGTNLATFYPNQIVKIQVQKIFEKLIKVTLTDFEYIQGIIPIKFVSDGMISTCFESEVGEGQFSDARIMGINKEDFGVDLSIRNRDLNESLDSAKSTKDSKFCDEWEKQDTSQLQTLHGRQNKRKKIALHHPFFKSVDYKEAEQLLAEKPAGQVIIRPSTKGQNHISLTWKLDQNVYEHLDIKEEDSGMGKMLLVNKLKFSELDEMLELYIYPMARNVQDIIKNPKYVPLPDIFEVERAISSQCKASRRSAYGFTINREKPGFFYLVYRHPNNNVKRESLQVLFDGYFFRNHKFRKVDEVVMYFKQDEAKKAAGR